MGKHDFGTKHNRCLEPALNIGVNNTDLMKLYSKINSGDILLTQTSGFVYKLWRKLSCTTYDHTAVVLENNETMNVVYPVAKKLPASHFFRPDKSVVVLRPVWKKDEQLKEFLMYMNQLEGTHYAYLRGIINVSNMVIYHRLGLKFPLGVPNPMSKRWVCTDAIIFHLQRVMPEFSKINKLDLDLFRFGFTSPNDFLRIAYFLPDLLKKVEL
jgi:hypothetical protein